MLLILAQTAVPLAAPTNVWDALVVMMPGVLAAIAAIVGVVMTGLNGKKTDRVHRTLIAETKTAAERQNAVTVAKLEARIAHLESDLKTQADQLVSALRAGPPVPAILVEPASPLALAAAKDRLLGFGPDGPR
jgi:hypothetical protein